MIIDSNCYIYIIPPFPALNAPVSREPQELSEFGMSILMTSSKTPQEALRKYQAQGLLGGSTVAAVSRRPGWVGWLWWVKKAPKWSPVVLDGSKKMCWNFSWNQMKVECFWPMVDMDFDLPESQHQSLVMSIVSMSRDLIPTMSHLWVKCFLGFRVA